MVDFREYVMAISMLIEGSAVEKLSWSFKVYDKDRDGAITKEEMLEIMQVRVLVLWYPKQTLYKAKAELFCSDDCCARCRIFKFDWWVFPCVRRPFIR